MVNKSCSQVVPTILTLALVACEGSIMGVADPEVESEAVSVHRRYARTTSRGSSGR